MDEYEYWVTYRRADGQLIHGEFSWVDDPQALDDLLDPTEIIKETWVLQSRETYTTSEHLYFEEYDYENED